MPLQERIDLLYVPQVVNAGQSLASQAAPLKGFLLVGILTPPTLSAPVLTFAVGLDPTTPYDFYRVDGSLVQATSGPARQILIVPEDFAGVVYVRLRAGTPQLPAPPSQPTEATFILRPI